MRVYAVYSGCYEDHHLIGLFSTKERAQEAIDIVKKTEKWLGEDIDEKPIPIELDTFKAPELVYFEYDENLDSWSLSNLKFSGEANDFNYFPEDKQFFVMVAYNPDPEVMLNTAKECYRKCKEEQNTTN